ncbi:OprO/OprP family phosphate-selective porin [Sphingomonas montana]|uniref:OprO/OprP family phosphate-selective porin n=1 Tax=Sphingomonas montana TaxID=1843236 RepID=UPI00096DDB1E|nr:porin [Sphingomonas montana]
MTDYRTLRRAAIALPLVLLPSVAWGQAADATAARPAAQMDLETLVRAQAARIEGLEERLRLLEVAGRADPAQAVASAAPATGVAKTAPAATTDTAAGKPPATGRILRFANAEAAPPAADPSKTGVKFVNGLPRLASADGRSWFRPRGRLFFDASATGGSDQGRNVSGTSLSSARLGFEGAVGDMSWALEGDFARNRVVWKSAFVTFRHPLFGLDAETSLGNRFNDRTMDGSAGVGAAQFRNFNVVAGAILPQRGYWGVGVQERVFGSNWHASLQATGEDPNNIGDNNDGFTVLSRVHWNPVKSKTATLHLGAWGFREGLPAGATGVVRNTALAGDFNTLVRLLPGTPGSVRSDVGYGVELAFVSGRFWTQNEWGRRVLYRDAGNLHHSAYSIDAGLFLFGGRPPYDARRGVWGRTIVDRPVTEGGPGVLSIQARYENVDYSDLPLGGQGRSLTLGTNWYLNGITRIMLDLTQWELDNRAGTNPGKDDGQTVNARFQLQF